MIARNHTTVLKRSSRTGLTRTVAKPYLHDHVRVYLDATIDGTSVSQWNCEKNAVVKDGTQGTHTRLMHTTSIHDKAYYPSSNATDIQAFSKDFHIANYSSIC